MRVLDARPRWFFNYANNPGVELFLEDAPAFEDMRFEQKGTLYFAHKDGKVDFFHYAGPGDGYGGQVFEIIMQDGTTRKLAGPWSSRSGVMNKVFSPQCTEVSYTEDFTVFARGYTFYTGAVSLEMLETALQFMPGVEIRKLSDSEPTYSIAIKGMPGKWEIDYKNHHGDTKKFLGDYWEYYGGDKHDAKAKYGRSYF